LAQFFPETLLYPRLQPVAHVAIGGDLLLARSLRGRRVDGRPVLDLDGKRTGELVLDVRRLAADRVVELDVDQALALRIPSGHGSHVEANGDGAAVRVEPFRLGERDRSRC
jgi:hypothetical protein